MSLFRIVTYIRNAHEPRGGTKWTGLFPTPSSCGASQPAAKRADQNQDAEANQPSISLLGREVKDEDVTSISAWMKADDRVVDSVINDNSREQAVENAMEDAFSSWAVAQDRKNFSFDSIANLFKRGR